MIAQDLKLFLEDQHAERKMEQGNLDKSRPTVRKLYERHAVKEKNYKEIFRQRCRLTKTQHIKEAAVFMTLDCKTLNLTIEILERY